MRRNSLLAGALAAALAVSAAYSATWFDSGGTTITPTVLHWQNGSNFAVPVSPSNPLPVSGTFSGFAPGSVYAAPISVTTSSVRSALPAGAQIIVYNTGANAAYVQLGGSSVSATLSADIVQPNCWMAYTVGSNTYIAAITASGGTTLNVSGGAGLPTGGCGSVGGGGSIPTGAAGSPNTGVLSVQGISGATNVGVSLTSLPPLAAGANAIGSITNTSFGISGSLPAFASTPAVNAAQSGAWNIGNITGSISLPTGAAIASKQPALGTAGTASGDVLTVQGIASMTPLKVDGSGVTQPVSGTFWQTTQPVSLASLPALASGANTIGTIGNTSFGISGTLPAFAAPPSFKPTASSSARNFPGCTVGVTSAQCLAAATAVSFVQIQNTSASASIACAWGATAVLNSSGSFQLAAGQSASWGPNTGGIPSGALNCIASGGSTPAFLEWN